MDEIIAPVDINLIKAELTPEKKLLVTTKGDNELYVVTWQDSPNVVTEIGRIREAAYREAGVSSGKSMDLDEFDTMDNPYKQLIVWDPKKQMIVGGYRFILGQDVQMKSDGQPNLTASGLYHFSDDFIQTYLPQTMELGRSFVSHDYKESKDNFVMDNLWDGITALVLGNPNINYFFGKMTIYPSYDPTAKDLIMHFLTKHFADKDNLIRPYHPEKPASNPRLMDVILDKEDPRQDFRNLKNAAQHLGTEIPPLVGSYIGTSSSIRICGSTVNEELGRALETAIMICFDDLYMDKQERHVAALESEYAKILKKYFPKLSPNDDNFNSRMEQRRKRLLESFQNRKGTGSSPDIEFL